MDILSIEPAHYYPFAIGRYEVKAGLSRFGKDFGNGKRDQQLFQRDRLAYQYQDPRCDTTRNVLCAGTSRTRYAWLTGNLAFADQTNQSQTLNNPNNYLGNHGFGSNLGTLITRVPDDAAVLFNKTTSKLETAVTTSTAPYVCQFDPANSYIEASIGVSTNVE